MSSKHVVRLVSAVLLSCGCVTAAAAQTSQQRLQVLSRQGDFYWVVATDAAGNTKGGWVSADVVDKIDTTDFRPVPGDASRANAGPSVSEPTDVDGMLLALQRLRDRVAAAAASVQGMPEAVSLKNRIQQIDEASAAIRQLSGHSASAFTAPPQPQPRSTAQTAPQPPATPTPVAMKPVDVIPNRQARQGFWFNAGMGAGSLAICQECGYGRETGLSGGLSLGATLTDRFLLGIGTSGWAKNFDGETLSVGTFDARLRFYPSRTNGFFVTGGLGLGSISFLGESEIGAGALFGVGYDIRVGRNVSITPFYNGFAMQSSLIDANVAQFGVGVTIH